MEVEVGTGMKSDLPRVSIFGLDPIKGRRTICYEIDSPWGTVRRETAEQMWDSEKKEWVLHGNLFVYSGPIIDSRNHFVSSRITYQFDKGTEKSKKIEDIYHKDAIKGYW